MKWRGRRMSDNVQDRRGMGGGIGRPAGIGGVGLVVVLLLGAFFGVDVSPLLTGSGGGLAPVQEPAGPNRIDDEDEAFVATVLAGTEDVWGRVFEASGMTYPDPSLVLFSEATRSGCGGAQSAMGPFYCPADQTIYLDTDFFRVMEQDLGATGGDFARAYVIAHEVGHHVQNQLGTLAEANRARGQVGQSESNAISVRVELQADCYAGMWARGAREYYEIDRQDVIDALDTAARIGDDALQQASQGVVVPDSFTHGTSEQRQRWFYKGYETGDPNACDTFSEPNP